MAYITYIGPKTPSCGALSVLFILAVTSGESRMQKFEIGVSEKDIPLPNKEYLKKMLVRRTYEHLV